MINRIKEVINSKEKSVRAFSKRIDFPYTTLHNYIIGERKTIDSNLLTKIISTYEDVSSKWILTGKGNIYSDDSQRESDNNIYHFTPKIENLVNIMNKKFLPFYREEDFSYIYNDDKKIPIYYPINCFCDIPIERTHLHMKKFGKYGIGLKKEWAEDKHLNVVSYTYDKSATATSIRILLNYFYSLEDKDEKYNEYKNALSILLMSYKPYWADKKKNIKLYDEKEWRNIVFENNDCWSISPLDYDDIDKFEIAKLEQQDKLQLSHKLDFNIDDIAHIFIENKSELKKFVNDIKMTYNEEEIIKIENLITINTMERKNSNNNTVTENSGIIAQGEGNTINNSGHNVKMGDNSYFNPNDLSNLTEMLKAKDYIIAKLRKQIEEKHDEFVIKNKETYKSCKEVILEKDRFIEKIITDRDVLIKSMMDREQEIVRNSYDRNRENSGRMDKMQEKLYELQMAILNIVNNKITNK